MYLFSGVTIEGEASARKRARSTLAVIPSIILSAMTRLVLASRRTDSSRLAAITGMPTLSSKAPLVPDEAMTVSLPMTWAHTMMEVSDLIAYLLAVILDEP